jgi:hypothetical protein
VTGDRRQLTVYISEVMIDRREMSHAYDRLQVTDDRLEVKDDR